MIDWVRKLIAVVRAANYRRLTRRREPERLAYQQWVAEHDSMTEEKHQAWEASYQSLTKRPLISVVMPVYNAPLRWLDAAIESVRSQVYETWELCIADDCSTDTQIKPYLQRKSQEDPRIKVCYRATNGHISAASNSAIEMATGDYIALLDQDDVLSPDALLAVAECIRQHPHAGIIYSDEDKIDEQNLRESPTRKTGWQRADLSRYNCISHLGIYETRLIREIGGFRVGYEGSQDHDLALRCAERLSDTQIIHIPKILYHWRSHPASTAYSKHAKPYASSARKKLIMEHKKPS